MSNGESSQPMTGAAFPQTLWTVVINSREGGKEALEKLCELYWRPMYAFVRRWGFDRQDARDHTQGIFMHILQNERLKRVSRDKGRFRNWVLACAKNYLLNVEVGGPRTIEGKPPIFIPPETEEGEEYYGPWAESAGDPDLIYDAGIAQEVVNQVRAKLQAEYTADGKEDLFNALEPHLTGDVSPRAYKEISRRLNRPEQSLRVEVHRMRRRFGKLLRAVVAEIVSSPDEVEDELRHLLAAWASVSK